MGLSFFPNIGKRFEAEWLISNKPITYLVSGHGLWGNYFERFGLSPAACCSCGHFPQDVNYVLWDCDLVRVPRERALEELRKINGGGCPGG